MPLRTSFTDLFAVEHPIALAPMGGSAGGALAAAVSNAGGLGLLGGGLGDAEWIERELEILTARATRPWGVGFITWTTDLATVVRTLEYQPVAVMLSFGDPAPFAQLIKDAGSKLIIQVTNPDEAQQAIEVGANVIVAQGDEAGGHGRSGRSTFTFVPTIVDLVAPIPVLAAGGIADGRGLAAALALGATGALIGTRFRASAEALISPTILDAMLSGRGGETERSQVVDIARGAPWPAGYSARTLRNKFLDEWRGREHELADSPAAQASYQEAVAREDLSATRSMWAKRSTSSPTPHRQPLSSNVS